MVVAWRFLSRVWSYTKFVHPNTSDGYNMAYKPITLLYIFFIFIKMKFVHCHSCVMFVVKSMSIYVMTK